MKPLDTITEIEDALGQAGMMFSDGNLAAAYGYLKKAKDKLDTLCEAM